MQRNKSLNLIAEIFNKLSSKTFISTTCQIHTTFLPMYICSGCFDSNKNTMCQQCFSSHTCQKKNKAQISRWVSQQQQKIIRYINNIQKDFQISKQSLLNTKLKVSQKQCQKSVSQINNQIITGISKKLQQSQKKIQQNCLDPAINGPIKSKVQKFMSNIKIQVDGLIGNFSQISQLSKYCQQTSIETQQFLKDQVQKTQRKCSQLYISSVEEVIHEVLNKIFDVQQTSEDVAQKQKINLKIFAGRLEGLQQQLKKQKDTNLELQQKIAKLQQSFTSQIQKLNKKQNQLKKQKQEVELQLQRTKNSLTQMQKKLSISKQFSAENSEKDTKVKKLELKCQLYEQQLSQLVRNKVNPSEKLELRYNMQDLANKLVDQSQKYQNLILQTNQKDKKISQLIIETNKLQIKIKQMANQNKNQGQYRSPGPGNYYPSPNHSNSNNLTPSNKLTPNHQLFRTPNHQTQSNSIKKQSRNQ